MISIPNLPSDSLYKFTFIGGLFSFFLCLYLSYGLLKENLNQRMEFVTKIIPEEGQKWYQDTLNIKRYHRLDSLYKVKTNDIEKEKLMEKMMMLSDQSANINYNRGRFENIKQTRKRSTQATLIAITFLMTVGFLSLLGAFFGWEKWSKQQQVLDDLILKQYELQNLEVRIKELELQKKINSLNLDERAPEGDLSSDDIESN